MVETKHQEFTVVHDEKEYEISNFLRNHPGGRNLVDSFKGRNITSKMKDTGHSKSAYYLLREYKKGGRDESSLPENEELEKLVDWDRGMLNQVASLGTRYNEWILSPVDRRVKLFDNPLLEYLTVTPWYVIPMVWIPVICFFVHKGIKSYCSFVQCESVPIVPVGLCLVFGVILWTLLEYSLHRWVFHIEPSGKSKAMIVFHFTIHGLHHKTPFDSLRLVFPPFPAAILAYIGYQLYASIFPSAVLYLIMAGTFLGYVLYDLTHYYLHYGSPTDGTYFYTLKRYHNQHHFVHHDSGFGISNRYWDSVFGTLITLRKLGVTLKW